jgi:hypothetical protein
MKIKDQTVDGGVHAKPHLENGWKPLFGWFRGNVKLNWDRREWVAYLCFLKSYEAEILKVGYMQWLKIVYKDKHI